MKKSSQQALLDAFKSNKNDVITPKLDNDPSSFVNSPPPTINANPFQSANTHATKAHVHPINDINPTFADTHTCAHCQQSFPFSALHKPEDISEDVYFCCKGCESVYRLLQNSGFGGFYARLGGITLTPPQAISNSYDYVNEPSFLHKHTRIITEHTSHSKRITPSTHTNTHNNKHRLNTPSAHKPLKHASYTLREVSIVIEGIHCAACIWLNEHILRLQKGITKALINYTNHKAIIQFISEEITLSQIFTLIESIGYRAHIYNPLAQEQHLAKEQQQHFVLFVVGVFGVMSIMMVAMAQYVGYFYGIDSTMKDVLNLTACALSLLVLSVTGRVFFTSAYYGLKQGFIGMDFLISFGASLTWLYSCYASITRSGESYFESVAMIVLFVFSGKMLEMRARRSAGDSLDMLHSMLPSVVSVESSNGIITRPVEELEIGDRVHIPVGGALPTDGIALHHASLDTRSLSGESMPCSIKPNEQVLSGSIVLEHSLCYEVSAKYAESTMSKIISLLEESLSSRPHIQEVAHQVARYFSRIVLCIACAGFCGWWWLDSFNQAVIISIAVIVIACPCALALATPIASVVGISRAFKAGLIVKEARFLEVLAHARTIVLDKTGTLTRGMPHVEDVARYEDIDENVLAHFVRHSSHPIAQAVARYMPLSAPLDFPPITQEHGGIRTQYQGVELLGGSVDFLRANGVKGLEMLEQERKNAKEKEIETSALKASKQALQKCEAKKLTQCAQDAYMNNVDSMSVFGYGVGGRLALMCYVSDMLKEGAHEFIALLRNQGKDIVLLSGDRRGAVESIARQLGISSYYSGVLPEEKARIVHSLREEKKEAKNGFALWRKRAGMQQGVVMIGDGLNDALALREADVGIAMGGGGVKGRVNAPSDRVPYMGDNDIINSNKGSAQAIAQSDIVVLDDSLRGVGEAFCIAQGTWRRIYENLALSLAYNALFIPLALAGYVIPLVAALSMSISSLLVVANSLRLRSYSQHLRF